MGRFEKMREIKWCVYKHTFPDGKVYIGITKNDPKKRWANGLGYKGQSVYNEIEKYGWKNIKHKVIVEGLNEFQAETIEKELIKAYGENAHNNRYAKPSPLKGKRPNREYSRSVWTINGETKSIDEWCKFYNVPRCRVHKNINKYGFTPLQALTFPPIPKYGGWNRDPIGYYKSMGLLEEDFNKGA